MAGRVAFMNVCFPPARRGFAPRCPRIAAALLLLQTLIFVALLLPRPAAAADAVTGSVSAAVENGFARLIFSLGSDVESQVKVANNILVITFDRQVDIKVDRIREGAPDYIGAARRDPDGKAVRMALSRRVTMNFMAAGDRLFVDLLPDGWTGLPPGLPREVIDDLARRARDAEKKLRQDRPAERDRKAALIRVRVASQPTFTRYTFQLPEPTSVAADNRKDKLTLTFNGMLNFDLSDAKAALPPARSSPFQTSAALPPQPISPGRAPLHSSPEPEPEPGPGPGPEGPAQRRAQGGCFSASPRARAAVSAPPRALAL